MHQRDNGCFNRVYGKTWVGYHLIAGQPQRGSSWFETRNPSHQGDRVGRFPEFPRALWPKVLEYAHQAQNHWKNPELRRDCLQRFLHSLSQHQEKIARCMTRETGWILPLSRTQVTYWLEHLKGQSMNRSETGLILFGPTAFGFDPPVREILPALQALFQGSGLIWFPGTSLPATAQYLSELLQQAQLPAGSFQLIHGTWLPPKASTHLPVHWLEPLPSPCSPPLWIRRQDSLKASLPKIQARLFEDWGPGRIVLVPNFMLSDLKGSLQKSLQALPVGDPNLDQRVQAGPLRNQSQLQAFLEHLQQAKGVELLSGLGRMTRNRHPEPFCGDPEQGLFVWPALWQVTGLPQSMPPLPALPGPGLYLFSYSTDAEAEYLQTQLSQALI